MTTTHYLISAITMLALCFVGLNRFPQYRIAWIAGATLFFFILVYNVISILSGQRTENTQETRQYADWEINMESELMKEGDCNMYKVSCEVRNTGTGTDYNATLYIAAELPDTDQVYDEKTFPLPVLAPSESHSVTTLLEIPAGEEIIISCTVIGDQTTIKAVTEPFEA